MKKIITLLLCGAMLVTSLPGGGSLGTSLAAAESSVKPISAEIISSPAPVTKDTSDKALEKAIKAVKAKITIPKEYSEFDYYFSQSNSYEASYWSLSWRNPSDHSYIQVDCDQAYHITYYNNYDYSQKRDNLPVYLKSELKSKAEEFIKQIAPEVAPKLEYLSSTYNGIYSGTYFYSYQRIENGISLPDNTVTVSVDSVTGKVQGASISWLYDVEVPSADAVLTKNQATDILKKNLKMNLIYQMNYYRIYDSISSSYTQKAFLVYTPEPSYISINAKTGEVYLNKSEWIQRNQTSKDEAEMDAGSATANKMALNGSGSISLTEEEIAKINELEKLITKDKAIELVTGNKALYIDDSLISYNAYLSKSYDRTGKEGSYVWNIDLRDARPVNYEKDTDTYRAYASAAVDAKTGKILSFYASIKSNYDNKENKWKTVNVKYSNEESRKVLETFLKEQVNSRFKNTKLVNTAEDYVAYYKEGNVPVYGGYRYQYNRVNEGIEFGYNGIYGSVDGVTGKIYSFSTNWDDSINFESPKAAMTADKALDAYLAKEGYHLVYEINQVNIYDPNYRGEKKYYDDSEAYSVQYEIRLVYRPDVNPQYISPFTGEQLNYDGTVYTKTKTFTYEDVPDTPENRKILLLADMNIGFEGNQFYPTKAITAKEFDTLLSQVGYYYPEESNTGTADKLLTREEVAYRLIDKLGLKKLAGLQGIYNTGFADEYDIRSDYRGAVALAKGLALMGANADNNFLPKQNVTRAEAVELIMSFIKVQREGIY